MFIGITLPFIFCKSCNYLSLHYIQRSKKVERLQKYRKFLALFQSLYGCTKVSTVFVPFAVGFYTSLFQNGALLSIVVMGFCGLRLLKYLKIYVRIVMYSLFCIHL